jgi:hypothetical protein
MRKAIIGILMAATAATPLIAQDNGASNRWAARQQQRAEQGEQRSEQREQRAQERQAARQEQVRQELPQRPERQGGWNGRGGGWAGRQAQQAPAQEVEQQQAGRYRDRSAGNWQGGYQRRQVEQQAQVQSQQQAWVERQREAQQQQGRSYRDRSGGAWQGRDGQQRYQQGGYNGQQRYGHQQSGTRDWRGRQGSNRGWDRGWRNDNRYDWQRYRSTNRSLFSRGNYYAPYRGYNYSRLNIGIVLDSLFYSNRYWIDDPYDYRLPMAPEGTQWVRYYDDVVLVDLYTGEVLDVIYGFFY